MEKSLFVNGKRVTSSDMIGRGLTANQSEGQGRGLDDGWLTTAHFQRVAEEIDGRWASRTKVLAKQSVSWWSQPFADPESSQPSVRPVEEGEQEEEEEDEEEEEEEEEETANTIESHGPEWRSSQRPTIEAETQQKTLNPRLAGRHSSRRKLTSVKSCTTLSTSGSMTPTRSIGLVPGPVAVSDRGSKEEEEDRARSVRSVVQNWRIQLHPSRTQIRRISLSPSPHVVIET